MTGILVTVTIIGLVLGGVGAPARAQAHDLKYSIMVGKFDKKSGYRGWNRLSGAWSTILADQLNSTGRFIVVGEHDMREEAMKEQAFVASCATAQG